MKYVFIFLAVILFLPVFFSISPVKAPAYNNKELFDPSLAKINSVQKLVGYSDSAAHVNNIKVGSLGYAVLVSSILRKRFYHGFSYYTLQKNWIAVTAQLLFGRDLAAPVNADEILKYPYAGCSQQAIVLMNVMKRKNVAYRSVGFPHHYALELNFKNNWYFFDTNMEPKMKDNEREEDKWNASADVLKKYYSGNYQYLDWTFGKSVPITFGKVNADPAPNASLFQNITGILSKILWIFPLLFVLIPFNGFTFSRK